MSKFAYCAIHPAVGVARVGDSPDDYFLGPETPGSGEEPASYKDRAGRVKRQAARFRIFGFDQDKKLIGEITADDAEITWTVHLVNRKGAAGRFAASSGRRNNDIPDARRGELVIDPGPRDIAGRQAAGVRADTGTFLGTPVPLGELRTDDEGRLIVLGGAGHSASVPDGAPLPSFADNDGWHDDTSDGPVTARVVLTGGEEVEVRQPAWVVVAPPDFAPAVGNLVTLYDVAEQAAYERGWILEPKEVSFERDVVPVLERAMGYQWVNQSATRGHRRAVNEGRGAERIGDFFEPDHLAQLRDPGDRSAKARKRVFAAIRKPVAEADAATAIKQATAAYMPQLSGDDGTATPGNPGTWFTVTPLQYRRLALWADGNFTAGDADPAPPTVPEQLDRAAMESCVGGPFFPGIEMSRRCREPERYAAPFRFRGDQPPGCMTENMAVPWQADFTDCRHFWWPAQRPDDVIVDEDYAAVTSALFPDGNTPSRPINTTAFPRWRWDRGIGDSLPTSLDARRRADRRHREMVQEWSQLGFVRPAADDTGVHVETERAPYVGLRDRDYFHIMLNLHKYPDFLPTAAKLAHGYLDAAAAYQQDPMVDTELRPFRYEERAFDARLDSIYQDLVDRVGRYDPANDRAFRTKADAIDRVRQSGPLNQTDGVWLRNVATIGPIDDLTGFLTQIWVDEVGAGDPAQNHANIFTATLSSVGINTAPITSIEYAQDDKLLDSAFTLPLFQLVVSQFTDQFLPELLGMTLYFEWESVELATTARLLQRFEIDPAYYRLHVAIDNADTGHGAIAKRAVKRYLARFADEDVRQQQWARIWNGYVAFRVTGTLGQDVVDSLLSPQRTRDRVLQMIDHKKRYGSLNHGDLPAGGMTNNLFDNPSQLLDTLVKSGQVVPGDPEKSPFLRQMDFGGHMYRVFSLEERQAWEEWIRSLAQPETTAPAAPATPAPATSASATSAAAPNPFAAAVKPAGDAEPAPEPPAEVPHLLYSSSAEEVSKHPRKTLLGHGAAH